MFKIEKMDLLVAIYIFCIAAAEMMGAKTFPLVKIFGYQLNASVAIFLFPLIFTINDVVVEVFGKARAQSIVRSGILVVALIFLCSIIFTSFPPSTRFAASESAYDKIFSLSARLSAASLIALVLAEFMDVAIFAKLKAKMHKKGLWLRNNLSNFIAQFIDTAVFMTLAFYAIGQPPEQNVVFLISLIIPYWLLKCFMSVIETPLVYLGVKWMKTEKK